MWLITTIIAAFGATGAWAVLPKKYNMSFLTLMLWGASIMILVDHVLGYEGGSFILMQTDGMISSGLMLGLVMLLPVFALWGLSFLFLKSGRWGK